MSDDYEKHRAIQSGETPAETIPQLVDAVRQNLAGAGADLGTVRMLLGHHLNADLGAALHRLERHLQAIDNKVSMALEHARQK